MKKIYICRFNYFLNFIFVMSIYFKILSYNKLYFHKMFLNNNATIIHHDEINISQ